MCPPPSVCPSIPIITPSQNSLPHFEKAIHSLREFPLVVEGNCATPLPPQRPSLFGTNHKRRSQNCEIGPFPLVTVPFTQLTRIAVSQSPFPLSADVVYACPLFSLRSHASGAVKDLRIPRIANAPFLSLSLPSSLFAPFSAFE